MQSLCLEIKPVPKWNCIMDDQNITSDSQLVIFFLWTPRRDILWAPRVHADPG